MQMSSCKRNGGSLTNILLDKLIMTDGKKSKLAYIHIQLRIIAFVMVGMMKDEIPAQDVARFQPDGTYVPRILFFTPDGEFMKDVYNRHPKADDKYKYFYSNTSQIIDSMILALERSEESLNDTLDKKVKKK